MKNWRDECEKNKKWKSGKNKKSWKVERMAVRVIFSYVGTTLGWLRGIFECVRNILGCVMNT